MRKVLTALILVAGYAALIETTDAACGGGGGRRGFLKRIFHPFKGGRMMASSSYGSMQVNGNMAFVEEEQPTGDFISNEAQDCCDSNAPGLRMLVPSNIGPFVQVPRQPACANCDGQEMMLVPMTVPVTRERHVIRRNGSERHVVRVLGFRQAMVAVPVQQTPPPMQKKPPASKPPEQAPKPAPVPNHQYEFTRNCPGLPVPDSILLGGQGTADEAANAPGLGLVLPVEEPPAAVEEQPAEQPQEQIARGRIFRRTSSGGGMMIRSGRSGGC
jgi:hypothetical protein